MSSCSSQSRLTPVIIRFLLLQRTAQRAEEHSKNSRLANTASPTLGADECRFISNETNVSSLSRIGRNAPSF